MHEHFKEKLNKMGTSHHTENPTHEHDGLTHRELHEIEGKHLAGKKHFRDEML